MLNNEQLETLVAYVSSRSLFPNVEIKGGICYYFINNEYSGDCQYTLVQDNISHTLMRKLNDFDVLIREPQLGKIVKKVMAVTAPEAVVSTIVSSDTPFGIASNPKTSKKNPCKVYAVSAPNHDTLLFHIEKQKRKVEYVERGRIRKNVSAIDKNKVFIPVAGGSGSDMTVLGRPEYAPCNSVCSQSYLFAAFETPEEAGNFIAYIKTKFLRVLVSAVKISQSAPKRVYRFVPLQNFGNDSDINWSAGTEKIDRQLYQKYGLSEEEITYIEGRIKLMHE